MSIKYVYVYVYTHGCTCIDLKLGGLIEHLYCRFEVSKYDACAQFRIHLKGVVISDYSYEPSHYSCIRSLGEWLSSQGIPGIYGVDTRAITKVIPRKWFNAGEIGSAREHAFSKLGNR